MKKYLPIFIFILGFAGFLGGQVGLSWFSPEKRIPDSPKFDSKNYESLFQSLSFKTIDNQQIDLNTLSSPIVILNFWASWCGPCLVEFPSLVDLKSKFSDKEVMIFGISSDEENSLFEIKKVIEKYNLNFPIVSDSNGEIFNQFDITGIPFSIIYNRGKILEINQGNKDFSSIETVETIKEALAKDLVLMGYNSKEIN